MELFYLSLAVILIILLICLFTSVIKKRIVDMLSIKKASCLYKRFGCCPDKLTARLDQDGTNCRGF